MCESGSDAIGDDYLHGNRHGREWLYEYLDGDGDGESGTGDRGERQQDDLCRQQYGIDGYRSCQL